MLLGSSEDELRNVLAGMATDLSAGNISGFIKALSSDMPGRDELRQQIAGLLAAYDLSCSVQIQTSSGDADRQSAQVDWYLSGRSSNDNAVMVQRREVLTIDFIRRNRRWVVAKLSPLAFFNSSN